MPPPRLPPHGGEARETNHEDAAELRVSHLTLGQTRVLAVSPITFISPPGHPLCDVSHTQPSTGEPEVLKLLPDTDGQADQPISGSGVGGETFVQDEHIGACDRGSDGFANLNARTCTLLEDCRKLLAPPSTKSNKVGREVRDS